ncbi:MAG: hypothetical protein V3V99_06135, partial [candidate division Zixibacteria bacterium]
MKCWQFLGGQSLKTVYILLIILLVGFINEVVCEETSSSGANYSSYFPRYDYFLNDANKIRLSLTNFGVLGAGRHFMNHASCEYPKNSYNEYLWGAELWFGGIIDGDTLVSSSSMDTDDWSDLIRTEIFPDWNNGDLKIRSRNKTGVNYDLNANSDLDIEFTLTDTMPSTWSYGMMPEDPYDNRYHKPLGIVIKHTSYTWDTDYTKDFIIIDYMIKNEGKKTIEDFYMGIYTVTAVGNKGDMGAGKSNNDELIGFKCVSAYSPGQCVPPDSINLMWWADNEGEAVNNCRYDYRSPRAAASFQFLRRPNENAKINFNWFVSGYHWAANFGPQLKDNYREFHYGTGYPTGDNNKYYLMSNGEIDYDQMFTVIDHQGEGFLPPPGMAFAVDVSNGFSPEGVLSTGPVDLAPGDSTFMTMALVFGDKFHWKPWSYLWYHDPWSPEAYFKYLDFRNLFENSYWAKFTFDNPGVDTDNDGYRGRYLWKCKCDDIDTCYEEGDFPIDTTRDCCYKRYFTGDGVPDFRIASPPPAPIVRTIPKHDKVTIRWNGKITEDYIDFFTQEK